MERYKKIEERHKEILKEKMGVKGLWTKVLADYDSQHWKFEETLPSRSVLLVDAFGFIFHILNVQLKSLYSRIEVRREFGGSYQILEDLVTREIQRLTRNFGFELIFYFDGEISYYKGDTTAKRREQLMESWNNMFYAGFCDGSKAQEDLPLPPLCSHVLQLLLDRYKIRYIKAETEADQKMALDCVNFNESEGEDRFFCYSADR